MSSHMDRKADKRHYGEFRGKDEHPESTQIPTPDHIENRIARYQIEAENDRSLFKDGLNENDHTEFDNSKPGNPKREREARAIIDKAIGENNDEPATRKYKRKSSEPTQVTATIDPEARRFLVKELNAEDTTISNFLKRMIYAELKRRGYNGPTNLPPNGAQVP